MRVSVLIVTFQSEGYIGACLKSVYLSDPRAEVIVVDNASTDGTAAEVAHFPHVKWVKNIANVGFSAAINQAASLASGDFLLLLNPDTQLCVTTIPRLVASLVRNPHYSAVGPISNNAGGMQSARHWFPTPTDTMNADYREKAAGFLINKFGARTVETKLLTGFALMIRTEEFKAQGGLDAELLLGFDDLDLCWRLAQQGKKIAVTLDSFVWHALHKSFEAGIPQEVEDLHKISLHYFTRKLIDYYGSLDQLPSSMDLWGVDWFVPAKIEVLGVAVLLLPNQQSSDALRFTLDYYLNAGVPANRLLVLDFSGANTAQNFNHVDFWIPSKGMLWSDCFEKLQSWWPNSRCLLVQSGYTLAMSDLKATEGFSFGSYGQANELMQQKAVGSTLMESWIWPWVLFDANAKVHDSWHWNALSIANRFDIFSKLVMQAESLHNYQAPVTQKLPAQFSKYLQNDLTTGVLGKGSLVDLNDQPIELENCQQLVWILHALELPALALTLHDLRVSGLQRVLFIIDNAFYQDSQKDSNKAVVNPLALRREIHQGGFAIDLVEAWESAPNVEYSEKYLGVTLSNPLTDSEKLYSEASRLLFVAHAAQETYHLNKKVSIIILALNQLPYTQQCIESIQTNCKQNYELILVDNGSTDGTEQYFNSIPLAKVIRNSTNRGVAAGWNQGLAVSTGDYALVLNNDTIVPPLCIENLVRCAENQSNTGLVVPRCNEIGGPQKLEGFAENSVEGMLEQAMQIQKHNALSCFEFPRLKGVAMLLPMAVVKAVGDFDEQFGIGNFEDDDYCYRIQKMQFKQFIADDAFIFHYGSVSFKAEKIDRDKLILENQIKFDQKWSNSTVSKDDSHSEGYALLASGDFVSAQNYFAKQFEVAPSAQVACGLGDTLVALNQGKNAFAMYCRALELDSTFEKAALGIVKILVSDYEVESAQSVLEYMRRKYPKIVAFQVNPSLQLNHDVKWKELIEETLASGDYIQAWSLLSELLKSQGEHFEICNGLGIVKYQQGAYEDALQWFEKALKFSPVDNDTLLNIYDCLLRLGIPQNAVRPMEFALSLDPTLHEIRLALEEIKALPMGKSWDAQGVIFAREANIEAEKLIREGLADRAEALLRDIYSQQPENYRAINNLGLMAWYKQQLPEAFGLFAMAINLNPWYIDAVVNLYDCAILGNRLHEFTPWLEKAKLANPGHAEIIRIEREISQNETPERLQSYFRKDAEQTKKSEQIKLGHQFLEEQRIDSAVLIFSEILQDYPDDVEALNGMGIAAFYHERYEDAMTIFKHALQSAPLDSDTLVNYWDAAVKMGEQDKAIMVLQNALSVDPTLTAVAAILKEV